MCKRQGEREGWSTLTSMLSSVCLLADLPLQSTLHVSGLVAEHTDSCDIQHWHAWHELTYGLLVTGQATPGMDWHVPVVCPGATTQVRPELGQHGLLMGLHTPELTQPAAASAGHGTKAHTPVLGQALINGCMQML
jgi:hypothetical protein